MISFAKQFYAAAYRFCCEEVGEENIISAVLHADERNKALSEELGRDVFHYHLHVVYLPVVPKEIRYTRRCKDPALVGTVKEVVNQISHSKRWKSEPVLSKDGQPLRDEKGRTILAPSYGALQTRFATYMQMHGYIDVERGIEGKRTEHRSIVDYKVSQDSARAKAAAAKAEQLESVNAQLTADITVQQELLTDLQDMTEYAEEVATCRSLLQEIFNTISTFFSRISLLRDKKEEAIFFENLQDKLVDFFARLRNLLGFELVAHLFLFAFLQEKGLRVTMLSTPLLHIFRIWLDEINSLSAARKNTIESDLFGFIAFLRELGLLRPSPIIPLRPRPTSPGNIRRAPDQYTMWLLDTYFSDFDNAIPTTYRCLYLLLRMIPSRDHEALFMLLDGFSVREDLMEINFPTHKETPNHRGVEVKHHRYADQYPESLLLRSLQEQKENAVRFHRLPIVAIAP